MSTPTVADLRQPEITDTFARFSASNVDMGNKTFRTISVPQNVEGCEDFAMKLISEGRDQHGFLTAALLAWSNHLPLKIKPDHVWLMALQGVATHVNSGENSEVLRDRFVDFKGKQELAIYRNFAPGDRRNDWAGCAQEFCELLGKRTKPFMTNVLQTRFTTTAHVDTVAANMTVMKVCEKYFTYKVYSLCGFPSITLEGSVDDWKSLRAAVEHLIRNACEEKFGNKWMAALLPVLDRFIDSRSGSVDPVFWDAMIKRGGGPRGSGSYSFYNGWVHVFFPYLKGPRTPLNRFCVPYSTSNEYVSMPRISEGVEWDDFPTGLVSVPVEWDCDGTQYKLTFNAGFVGAEQDEADNGLRARVSWFVLREEERWEAVQGHKQSQRMF